MNELVLLLVIALMACVTYLPRMLPLVVLHRLRLPSFLKRQFQFIPFAVLGALIFPGVLHSTASISSAAVGAITAALLAFFRVNLLFVVLGSIIAVFIMERVAAI